MGSVPRHSPERRHGWWLGAWIPCVLLGHTACTGYGQREPEVTSVQCMDSRDNDGDGLRDCADPSCRGARICAFPQQDGGEDAGPVIPPPVGNDEDAEMPTVPIDPPVTMDAGDPTRPVRDASMPPPDAAEPTDASDCPAPCLPTTAAVKLRVTSAIVPNVDANFRPYDIPLFYPDPVRSGLGPDPFVAILVDGEPVHTTSYVVDTTEPTWTEAGVRLEISSAAIIQFEALEYDGNDPDNPPERMFICTPELPEELPPVTAVVVQCMTSSNSVIYALLEPAT